MSDATKAVFLSYAREDAEAARRIAEALRAFGVEVWFDQNELRGGDQWDQKIRTQIKTCALFVPIVSQQTEERAEGYFRREWKLAVDRTHDMGSNRAFIVPVVIDGTKESGADVPEEFMRYQWTRLAGGEPTPEFVTQVKRLLEAPRRTAALRPEVGGQRTEVRGQRAEDGGQTTEPARKGRGGWKLAAAAVVVFGLSAYFGFRPASAPPSAPAASSAPAPAAKPSMDFASAKSIAVLPFTNMSAEKENEFFADGMHDELLTALAKIGALKVISRTSVLAYRDPAKRNLKQIAAELGVAHVLEGSVSRAGNRVRIIVQLIDAATDQHRWAETYNRDVSDVFQVQADISAQIAQALAATISPELKKALALKLTGNSAAYDLYLRARGWRDSLRDELKWDLAKWEELVVAPLDRAVALDPTFAAAFAELSQVHSFLYWWRQLDPVPTRLEKSKAAVDQALRLDPALPVAHSALGYYHYVGSLDYARATEEFAIALAGMPGDPQVLLHLAATQRRQGRWAEAAANCERAFAINPRNPDISGTWIECLIALRYYAQAERAIDRALAIFPGNSRLLEKKAQVRFAQDGDRVRSRAARDAIPQAAGESALPRDPRLVQFLAACEDGRYAEAVKIIDEAPELLGQTASDDYRLRRYFFAATAIGAREKARDRALALIAEVKSEPVRSRDEGRRVARLALWQAYAGQPGEARTLADRGLTVISANRDAVEAPVVRADVAQVYLALGERDRALQLLDQALSVPSRLIAHELRSEPWWAALRDDPRFEAALAKAAPRE